MNASKRFAFSTAALIVILGLGIASPRAQADCASKFNYTLKQRSSNYIPLLAGSAAMGGAAAWAVVKNNNDQTAAPNSLNSPGDTRANNDFIIGTMSTGSAYLLYKGIRSDRKHAHPTEQLLVDAEAGYGKELERFTNSILKDQSLKNADRYVIREILVAGNRSEEYCNGRPEKEDLIRADVKQKLRSGWHPSDAQISADDSTFSSSNPNR